MIILGLLIMTDLMRSTTLFLLIPLWINLNFQQILAQAILLPDTTISKWKQFYIQSYGADYNLITGTKYLNLHPSAEGHPFFGEDCFYQGWLMVNHLAYENVSLKYDLCRQQVILQYRHYSGSTESIILNERYISEFEITGRLFRKYFFPGIEPGFYQVLSQDSISCLCYWKKDLVQDHSSGVLYRYLPEKKQDYLLMDQKIYPFRSRGSFVRLFPETCQKEIRHYIRSWEIWFGLANEKQIQQLMVYCNEVIRNTKP
jgi:hypothetical protein